MIIKSYAKINLDFKILDKMPNGYHNISSVFQAVSLHDLITVTKIENGFQLSGSMVCPAEDNLITRTRKKLEDYAGKNLPCAIQLIKSIPIGAGLGGGSSNAASVLVGLNELYSLDIEKNVLIKIGAEVGSDIPFFISNKKTAFVEGIGEQIKLSQRKISRYYVLARPHKRIDTADMYKKHDETKKSFFELASEICPDVEKMHNYFSLASNEVGMSGSGPTIFAGFDDYNKAAESIEKYGIKKFNGDFFICEPTAGTYEIM